MGSQTSDTTLVTTTARVGAMCQLRSSVPKVANSNPAVTNDKSPISPCGADGGERFGADHGEADHDDRGPDRARGRELFLQHHGREQKPAERGAGGLDHAAMGERHEEKAGIAEQRERQPAGERQPDPLRPADAAEVSKAVADDERQAREAGPDEAMKRDVRG